MTIPTFTGNPVLSYANSDFFACTNDPEFSEATLPARGAPTCTAISTSEALADYREAPWDVGLMVMAGSDELQGAIDAALAEVQASTDVLPYTQLCVAYVNSTASDAALDSVKATATSLSCPTGRLSTSAPVAMIGPSAGPRAAGFLEWSHRAALPALTFDIAAEWPDEYAAVRASPSDRAYAEAIESVLNHLDWTSVVVLHSEAYSAIAELVSASATLTEQAAVTETSLISDLLEQYAGLGFRVYVLLGSDEETTSWLGVANSQSRLEGYGYVSLSAAASQQMPGSIYIADPIESAAYAQDAVWTLAHGVHNFIESWQTGTKGNEEISNLLSSSTELLAEVKYIKLYFLFFIFYFLLK